MSIQPFSPLPHVFRLASLAALALLALPAPAAAQPGGARLTLDEARTLARRNSPELDAARAAIVAARGRERQAAMLPNPTFAVTREQVSGAGQSNAQQVALLDQPVELGGLRAARREAAVARREAAEAMFGQAEAQLEFQVAEAYATALAADRRAALAEQAAASFTEALRISELRLAAGDVSGYAHRRLRLEAARYGTLRAEASRDRRSARIALRSMVSPDPDSLGALDLLLADSLPRRAAGYRRDSLVVVALRSRGELRASEAEGRAVAADARLAAGARTPVPVVSAGVRTERMATPTGDGQGLRGFVVGVALPVPLWDRRVGAIEAAQADVQRQAAETAALRRRVAREVADALDALRAVEAQVEMLAPQLGAESASALRAAQVAYGEGEITLVDWLDAVRAYRDAEASFATMQAELLIRHAALQRAVGAPLRTGAAAADEPSPGAGTPSGAAR